MTRRRRPRTAQERVIGALGTVAPGSLGGRIRNSRPAVVPTRNTGQQPDPTPGFDPNENPIIIGHNATGGGGSTPTVLTGAAARIVVVGASASADGADAVAVGDSAGAEGTCVAVGSSARSLGTNGVMIGYQASTPGGSALDQTTGVGYGVTVNTNLSTAVGAAAEAGSPFGVTSPKATAVGANSRSFHSHATSLGADSVSTKDNQVMLGTHSDFVEIPGDSSTAPNGLVQTDTADGTRYIIQITSGALVLSAAP